MLSFPSFFWLLFLIIVLESKQGQWTLKYQFILYISELLTLSLTLPRVGGPVERELCLVSSYILKLTRPDIIFYNPPS